MAEFGTKSATFGVWPTNGSSSKQDRGACGLGKTQQRSVKTFTNYDCYERKVAEGSFLRTLNSGPNSCRYTDGIIGLQTIRTFCTLA